MTSNAVQNEAVAELTVQAQTVNYREPPPPYSETDTTQTRQPVHTQPGQDHAVPTPLQDRPTYFNCSACRESVLTKVEYVNTQKTHMLAGFICGLTCWCMLCCLGAIPYAIPTFKKAKHFCPNCGCFLGDYTKL